MYRDRLILYGCGDFINDYEGIGGYESFRGDLRLMYFVDLDAADGRTGGRAIDRRAAGPDAVQATPSGTCPRGGCELAVRRP